jgi:hypothetical protein
MGNCNKSDHYCVKQYVVPTGRGFFFVVLCSINIRSRDQDGPNARLVVFIKKTSDYFMNQFRNISIQLSIDLIPLPFFQKRKGSNRKINIS